MKRTYVSSVIILLSLFQIIACSKDKMDPPPMLDIKKEDLSLNYPAEGVQRDLIIQTNLENIKLISSVDWCNATYSSGVSKCISISTSENEAFEVRKGSIEVRAGSLTETISVTQLGLKPVIVLNTKSIDVDFKRGDISVDLATNLELDVTFSESWIKSKTRSKKGMVDLVYEFQVDQLQDGITERIGKIYFQQQGGVQKDSVIITQRLTSTTEYEPAASNSFEKDKRLEVISSTLTPSDKYQSGFEIQKSCDGKISTQFNTPWEGITAQSPITLEYELDPEDASVANYVVLSPRVSGPNGIIKSATVWINTAEDAKYRQVADINVTQSNNPVVVRFASPVLNPRHVKIIVTDTYSGDAGKYYVTLAEFECYESRSLNALEGDMAFFTDGTFSELMPGTTLADIVNIKNPFLQNIASFLIAGTYPVESRVMDVEPFREVSDLAKELKTSPYSEFENITGIYFQKDQDVVVFVGNTHGESISLRVRDFGQSGNDQIYALSEGLNVLTMKGQGNGYLNYYTPNYESVEKVKIHIASGSVNGYFDLSRHSNEDGKALLDHAVSEIMDIKGKRVHLAYTVKALKQQSYGKIGDLISLYDSIIGSEQSLMGLRKYNRLPKNHMFGRVVWSGYMYADGMGAAFNENTMGDVANPDRVAKACWGIAHEFGHVNQVRPGMKWVGTTECTNNLYSAWIQYCFTPKDLRLENEPVNAVPGGSYVAGGRFTAYLNSAFVKNEEWCLQGGPDDWYGENGSGQWSADHFVKLCPIWQLHLYYHIAGEGNPWSKPYFWSDVFEKVRLTDESALSAGDLQMNFVKNVCDALKQDLSDFFIKTGFLKEVDKIFADYTSERKTITQSMIDETTAYISKYPKPQTDYIHYISGNSIDAYKDKLDVSGQYGKGISGTTTKTIQYKIWKNVTVFETYKGDERTNITMVGTGSSDRSFSQVPFPDGSTRIDAVGYDGNRILVLGNR